jgi:hypothetical protein
MEGQIHTVVTRRLTVKVSEMTTSDSIVFSVNVVNMGMFHNTSHLGVQLMPEFSLFSHLGLV